MMSVPVKMLTNLVLVLALGYLVVCALVYVLQEKLVWFPGQPPATDPGMLGLAYEDARIRTEDGVALHGWFMPGGPEAVLVSHGNAGTVAERLGLADAFLGMGRSVLLYDYRGYGRSEGRPTEEGTYRDAVAAFDWLVARGFASGLITSYCARQAGEPAGLVLEHAFVSVPELGARVYPWLPVRLLARIHYDSLADAPELRLPVLVVHSPEDELVPIGHGRKLYEALPGPKRFLETDGGHNHGGFLQRAEWHEAIRRFLDGQD